MKISASFATAALSLAAALLPARAEPQQLLESGSFEWPPVVARRTRADGADLSKSAMNAEWLVFKDKPDAEGGQLQFGLTNQLARTGRQCMFVEFNKLTKPQASAELSSDLLPILPNQPYHIAIWGRIEKERPLTLAERTPYLKLRVDWFKADQEEQTGDVVWKVQPIPGPKKRKPLFTTTEWKEFFANVKSPEDAGFIKITWYLETSNEEGETDGVIYFDDAAIIGESGPKEDPLDTIEKEEAERAAAEGKDPAASTPPTAPTPPAPSTPPPPPAPPAKPAASKPSIEVIPVR